MKHQKKKRPKERLPTSGCARARKKRPFYSSENFMLISVDVPGIKRAANGLIDKWDEMRESDRKKALEAIREDDVKFAFVYRNHVITDVIVKSFRLKRFRGLKTVETEGAVSPLECIKKLGSGKAPKSLGRGAFGEVFAHPTDSARVFKVIVDQEGDPEAALREAEITKRAAALGVSPKFHGMRVCCSPDGNCVLVLELSALRITLADWLNKKRSAAVRNKVLRDIESALAKLHEAGITHNDVHLRNIMLDDKNRPYIIDFSEAVSVGVDRADGRKRFAALKREFVTGLVDVLENPDVMQQRRRFGHGNMEDVFRFVCAGLAKEVRLSTSARRAPGTRS